MSDDLLLSLLWALPLVGSILVILLPKRAEPAAKSIALAVTLITFLLTLVAWGAYHNLRGPDGNTPTLAARTVANTLEAADGFVATTAQGAPRDLVIRHAWVPYFNIQYYLGLDGISLSLIVLTGLTSVLACLASWTITKQVRGYFSLFLLLLASMMGVFLALDLFLFYVFFEVMLLPMYFLIALWGGENREYAAIKFLLYTLFGSVFILVAILILYFWTGTPGGLYMLDGQSFSAHSFDAIWLSQAVIGTDYYSRSIQGVIFALFFIGFAVKLPSFPFHTWLPDAHVQAPTPISMILAGVLLKVGGYGLIRLAWPLAPLGALDWSWYVAALGVFSILYGAFAAMAQTDFKKLVAYSSVSHMGYITLGLAAMSLSGDPRYYAYGVNGAMFMMIAHGVTSAGMFFLVGVIYDRLHTRDLAKLGGLFTPMPGYGVVTLLIFFGSMGLPGLCGFIAEVFVVLAAFHYNVWLGVLAAAAVVLTAGYILWTLQRVLLGRNEAHHGVPDLSPREWAISIPLVVLTVVLGVFPQSLLSWMGPSVVDVVHDLQRAQLRAEADAPGQAPAVAGITLPVSEPR
jgi:NADH-quinone oxidoreductase subunit M